METLNYHHLYYFWTVCHEGGFTKAATKLRLSQSAISEQVRRLEEVLGQTLLLRSTRSFKLTQAGHAAFNYSETIFNTGQELLDYMHHRPNSFKQILRIGSVGSLSRNLQAAFLTPLLTRSDVQFSITIGDSKRLLRMLHDYALDVMLSTFPPGQVASNELYTHLLTQSPLCLVCTKDLISNKASGDLKTLLKEHRLLLPSSNLESRSELDYYLESNSLKFNLLGEIDDVALLRSLALLGQALVVIPKLGVIKDVESNNLVILHEFSNITQKFYAITRQKKVPNPIVENLVRLFQQ